MPKGVFVRTAQTRANIAAGMLGKKRGPYSAEHRAKIAEGNRGKVPSAETREKLRAAKLANPTRYWLGKKRGPMPEQTRAAINKANVGRRQTADAKAKISKTLFGHVAAHGRRCPYGDIVFRSSFEVRVARALDSLGVRWSYESRRFNLGSCTYTPDFYLIDDDAYWEVKGWYGPDSRRKVELFRRLFPDVPLVVFTKECIEILESHVRRAA